MIYRYIIQPYYRVVNKFDDDDIYDYLIEKNKTEDQTETIKDETQTIPKTIITPQKDEDKLEFTRIISVRKIGLTK